MPNLEETTRQQAMKTRAARNAGMLWTAENEEVCCFRPIDRRSDRFRREGDQIDECLGGDDWRWNACGLDAIVVNGDVGVNTSTVERQQDKGHNETK